MITADPVGSRGDVKTCLMTILVADFQVSVLSWENVLTLR